MIRITRDLMLEVRGMLERKWDCIEIANKLNIDADDVRIIIDLVNNIFT
jgi:hypothetical protein